MTTYRRKECLISDFMRDRVENGPFVEGRPAVMNDARPAISNATTALFPSDVNPTGNSATEYRTREDSEPGNEASPTWFLLSNLLSYTASLRALAHVTLASTVSKKR